MVTSYILVLECVQPQLSQYAKIYCYPEVIRSTVCLTVTTQGKDESNPILLQTTCFQIDHLFEQLDLLSHTKFTK